MNSKGHEKELKSPVASAGKDAGNIDITPEEVLKALELLEGGNDDIDKPLTVKQLKEMVGKPVFVVSKDRKEWYIVHSFHTDDVVGGGFILTKRTAAKEIFSYDGIGTEWEAYSVEPFENAANGILNTDDFGAICNCAVRYAIGRRSYMPSIVCRFMKSAIRHLNEKTIGCMERDIREADKYGWGYGDTCDYYEWMKLLEVIHKHMDENGIKRWP